MARKVLAEQRVSYCLGWPSTCYVVKVDFELPWSCSTHLQWDYRHVSTCLELSNFYKNHYNPTL